MDHQYVITPVWSTPMKFYSGVGLIKSLTIDKERGLIYGADSLSKQILRLNYTSFIMKEHNHDNISGGYPPLEDQIINP